ncbi:hypothetical protein PHMEG_00011800 [Phytophthora megakarya]|uniref:MULE transposase domain-containing protein n=1 Tax=Phytophthora megakarya TaxID=4795 RepID=A0A225WAD8_9STRA|nr:hypothetical protein PHMEG_00011800 [Phytophthora megakarya]
MPPQLQCVGLAHHMPQHDSELLLQSFIPFKISKSNLRPCNIYTELTAHNKRSQLLSCKSKTCATASPCARCPWRGKLETCDELKIVTLAEIGAHITQVRSPQSPRLTAKSLQSKELNLSRIRIGMMRRFDLHYRSCQLFNDMWGTIRDATLVLTTSTILLRTKLKPLPTLAARKTTFGWRETVDGMPHVGKGTDEDPFILSITSKRLLQSAARDPSTFVLHVDTTFKLNSSYYPVVVIGVSDRLRSFHLLALFIVSQRTEPVYVEVLASLHRAFSASLVCQSKLTM